MGSGLLVNNNLKKADPSPDHRSCNRLRASGFDYLRLIEDRNLDWG